MKDVIASSCGFHTGVGIANISFNKSEGWIICEFLYVFPVPGSKVVEAYNPVILFQKVFNQIGTDKSSTSGDQDLCICKLVQNGWFFKYRTRMTGIGQIYTDIKTRSTNLTDLTDSTIHQTHYQ